MDGDFSVLVGEWKCTYRHAGGSSPMEDLIGTKYEHTLTIFSNGKYKMEFSNGKTDRGRIRNVDIEGAITFNIEFVPYWLAHNEIIISETYKVSCNGNNLAIKHLGASGYDYHYTKVN